MPDNNRSEGARPPAETYRQKALELCAAANKTSDPFVRAELESLALVYMQLAEKSERTAAEPTAARGRKSDPEKE